MPDAGAGSSVNSPVFTLVLIALVVGRFLFRELRQQKLALRTMFLVPGILAAIALWLLYTVATLSPETLPLLAGETVLALAVGIGIGFAVSHFTTVRLGASPQIVYVLGSLQSVAIWVGAFALRFAARFALGHETRMTQLSANAALVVLVTAALAMRRYRIVLDARKLAAQGSNAAVRVV